MAGTTVISLELSEFDGEISELADATRAFILLRWHGTPVGQVEWPTRGGPVSRVALREAIESHLDPGAMRRWLARELDGPVEAPAANLPAATVAVCTRDRPQDLERCLDALMNMPDMGHEILVIDNCPSTGATRELVSRYPRVRYVLEERRGLDHARNRALREARGEVIAFTDDDAAPEPQWLGALLSNFEHPLVLCVTGLTLPLELETAAQEAFERYTPFGRGYSRRVFDWQYCNVLAVRSAGSGVNMALRRSVLERVGPFDVALDAGTATKSGGESELFSRILAAGYRIVYEPSALSWHRHRRTWSELRNTVRGYGTGVYAAWASRLVQGRELTVFVMAGWWLLGTQLPNLARALLRRPRSVPLDLAWAELCGCAAGPAAYFSERRTRPDSVVDAGAPSAPLLTQAQPPATPHPAPRVSLIIPTHNRCASLKRTLDALAAQRYPAQAMELVVVADGCTDRTVETVRGMTLPFDVRIVEQPSSGAATARNQGAAAARGEVLLFIDDDMEPNPHFVAAHAQAHSAHPGCVALGPSLPAYPNAPGLFQMSLRGWWADLFHSMGRPDHRFTYQDLCSGNVSLPAGLFAQVGGFDTAFREAGGEDWELGIRLLQRDTPFVFVPQAHALHHDASDLDRGFSRARRAGQAHVHMVRKHAEALPTLPIAQLALMPPLVRGILRALALEVPWLGERFARSVRPFLTFFEAARLRGPWLRLYGVIWACWYYRGVAQEAGSATWKEFTQMSRNGKTR